MAHCSSISFVPVINTLKVALNHYFLLLFTKVLVSSSWAVRFVGPSGIELSQLFSSVLKSDLSVLDCLHTFCFIKETVLLIGSSLHVLEDLKQDPFSSCFVKFRFRRKDLPQLRQVLFPCNAVNVVEQLGVHVSKLSFLTMGMFGP